jgi:putative ABC transport system substrate-binding protein
MKRREFIAGVGSAAAWPLMARGQQAAMPVVGFIDMRSTNSYEPFVRGLSEIGYLDRVNVFIDHREADHVDQLPAIGAELSKML